MTNSKFVLLLLFLFSCSDNDMEQIHFEEVDRTGWQEIVTDASGRQYPFLDPNVISYCGPGWGRKFCRFLDNYEGTIWADSDNYFSDFSDIKFSNFSSGAYFISFFDLDNNVSYCEGWKLGETTNDGVKQNIRIKKDEKDVLWFDYDYYGNSEDIEYTITYKYEVIEGLLHFSSTDGQSFIFNPSERNYSRDTINTSEIVELNGCLFY